MNNIITPAMAQQLLGKRIAYDKANRLTNRLLSRGRDYINWPKVKQYIKSMKEGEYEARHTFGRSETNSHASPKRQRK